jgi:hypothetical protein
MSSLHNTSKYKSGQVIKGSPKIFPIIDHFGILIVENGNVFVLHNTPFKGSITESLKEWEKSRFKIKIKDSKLIGKSNSDIKKQFLKCKKDYNLFSYNCEHFIDCMEGKKQRSEQILLFAGSIAAFLVYRKFVKK